MYPRIEPVVATYWHLVNLVGQKESAKSEWFEQGAFVNKLSSRQGDWLCHLADILVTLLVLARQGQWGHSDVARPPHPLLTCAAGHEGRRHLRWLELFALSFWALADRSPRAIFPLKLKKSLVWPGFEPKSFISTTNDHNQYTSRMW